MIGWLVNLAKTRPTGVWSWVLAGLFLAAAVVLRLALAGWLDPIPFTTFYPAVVASTLLCGWRQGALVLVLSTTAAWFYFVKPGLSFAIGFEDGSGGWKPDISSRADACPRRGSRPALILRSSTL